MDTSDTPLPMQDDQVIRAQDLIVPGGRIDQEALFRLYEQHAQQDDERPVTIEFKLQRDLKKRLDRYLVDRVPWMSRTTVQGLIKEDAVTVNGRLPKASTNLRLGDRIVVVLPPPPSTEIPPEEIPLTIIHEDESIVIINKQDDIIVHPARGHRSGTMINALAWHFQNASDGTLSSVGEEYARPGVVHRLDRHTTGVMVAAKMDTAHWRLGRQFEQRTVQKRYLAVVHGRLAERAQVIDMPLGKHPTIRGRHAIRHDSTGKQAITICRVRETYNGYSLVELELKTGRTHQIRVHLSAIGHPIAGDDFYGGRHLSIGDVADEQADSGDDTPLLQRQALHATTLGFEHPVTKERVQYTAPLHDDMKRLIALLRLNRFRQSFPVGPSPIDLDEIGIGPPPGVTGDEDSTQLQ